MIRCWGSLGCGVQQDPYRAIELWAVAADEGHAGAQYNLGMHLAQLDGSENQRRALQLMKQAAAQGNKKAQSFVKEHDVFTDGNRWHEFEICTHKERAPHPNSTRAASGCCWVALW